MSCLIPRIRQKVIHCYNSAELDKPCVILLQLDCFLLHFFATRLFYQRKVSPITAAATDRIFVMISIGAVYIEIDRPAHTPPVYFLYFL